jgi:hypothetical protein
MLQDSQLQDMFSVFALFICGLFNDAVSSSDYIASNDMVISE